MQYLTLKSIIIVIITIVTSNLLFAMDNEHKNNTLDNVSEQIMRQEFALYASRYPDARIVTSPKDGVIIILPIASYLMDKFGVTSQELYEAFDKLKASLSSVADKNPVKQITYGNLYVKANPTSGEVFMLYRIN